MIYLGGIADWTVSSSGVSGTGHQIIVMFYGFEGILALYWSRLFSLNGMKSRRKISEANKLQLFVMLSGKQVLTMPLQGEDWGQGQFYVGEISKIHIC